VRTVDELINPVIGSWDIDLIRSLFWPVDVQRILQIPIHIGRDDVVAWNHSRNGLFSVKSAYHCQWVHKFGRNMAAPNASGAGDNLVWKKLWELKTPAKIKIFGWIILHGVIPCRTILANRHITNVGSCPVCSSGCEDIKHMIFLCPRSVWTQLGLWNRIENILRVDRSGSVVLEEVIRCGGSIKELNGVGFAELIITGSWYL